MSSAHSYIGPTFSKKFATMLQCSLVFTYILRQELNMNISLTKICQMVGLLFLISDRFQRPPKVAPGARAPLCPPLAMPLTLSVHCFYYMCATWEEDFKWISLF